MTNEIHVRQSFIEQAEICASLGSSFMQHLCMGLAKDLDKSTQTGKRILEWQGDPQPKGDALALRLTGGLHALVRRGKYPELREYYDNPNGAADSSFMPHILSLITQEDLDLLSWLDSPPQTNEVARSSVIFAGLSVVAEQFRKPITLFELGSSGGLNLQVAKFGYRFSGKLFGVKNSVLQLNPEWVGSMPEKIDLNVINRRGCDLNPLSVEVEQDREKLVAYLWPDQMARIERVKSAIEIAKQNPPKLDIADAADWVETVFAKTDGTGSVRVLFHTIAQNYFPQSVKDRIRKTVEDTGAHVTDENPLAWLSFEFEGDGDPKLRLQTWPGGESRILATADPHVYAVNWIN